MAMSYIGKTISLISQSDVRYRGILAGIDHQQRTIQLSNVFSLGTEARRTGDQFIPPNPEPYQYIIFRAQEVKDLSVDEQHPTRNVHEDPAVMNASQAAPQPYGQQAYPMQPQAPMPPAQPPLQPVQPAPQANQPAAPQRRATGGSVQTATASLETIERAIGDLRDGRPGGGGRRGGRNSGGQGAASEPLRVPTSDFDFAGNNARFDKAGLRSPNSPAVASPDAVTNGETNGTQEAEEAAYNPGKSFFDNLTPARGGPGGGERGRGGRGGRGRSRRDEERDKNVATFGEPGGVGLMGPGAYVGGWGGYGRRGGRRGGPGRGGGEGGQRGQSRT